MNFIIPSITSLDGSEIFQQSLSSSYTYSISGTITAGAEVLTEYIIIADGGGFQNSIIYQGQGQWGISDFLIYTPVQSQLFSIEVTLFDIKRLSDVSLFISQQSVKDDYPNTDRSVSVPIININNTVYGKIETWITGEVEIKDVDVFKIYLNSKISYNLFSDNNSSGTSPALAIVSSSGFLVGNTQFNNIDFTPIDSGYCYIYVGSDQEINYNLRVSINAADTTAPTVSTFMPTDGATGVTVGSNISITFSEAIARGASTITLRSDSATGTIVESFDAATSGRLTLSGSTLTIDPTNNLVAGTQYFVVMPSGAVRDVAGNNYAGTNIYDFTTAAAADTTAPTVTSFSPTDAATSVAVGANIVLTFSEAIVRGTGTITLRSGSTTGAVVESFDAANSNRLTFSGSTLTIDPTNNLANNTSYFVTFASGAVKDTAGNAYAGTSSYDFQTTPLAQGVTVAGTSGNDVLSGTQNRDVIQGLAGNDTIDGGSNVDTAIVSGLRAAYTTTQTSTGVWSVVGPDGTDTLRNIEYLKFDDQTMRLLPGTGTTVNFQTDSPATFMSGIRDFDGNDIGASSGWKRIGAVDVNGDGDIDQIFVNRTNGRLAEVGTAPDGKVYFNDYGWAGETRVVGIYIDPLVQQGQVTAGGPNDSQRRFQNDLNIDNIGRVLGAADYDRDGLQEVYFALTDGTAYLHTYMHADGNIQYANYQSKQEVVDYLAKNGWAAATTNGWFV